MIIDVSKTSGQYQPNGNTLTFKVESTDNPADSDFWKFKHTWYPSNQTFTVKSIYHESTKLNGINSPGALISVSGFFSGNNSSGTPLLVELALSGGSNYKYYHKQNKGDSRWIELVRTDQLVEGNLKELLEKLKEIYIPAEKSTAQKVLEGFGGTTAGGLATAEAVNYTLNTGWSIFRRVTAIFTAAI